MHISKFLSAAALLVMAYTPLTHAAESAIEATTIAQTEVESVDKKGKKTVKRIAVTKAVPGTEVIYTTTLKNVIKKPVGNIVIDNPIPKEMAYKAGSAFGKNCEILFSADGGKTYGHAEELKITGEDGQERTALPNEYTHVRWTYKAELAAGKSADVGFRAIIR